MNTEDVRFVVAWMLSPSLEAASAVLGMGPGCVIRRAEQMRAAGVPLKDIGDMQVGQGEITKTQTNDMQVSPPAGEKSDETTSYVSRLSTDDQLQFYAKYTVGRNGGPSIAEMALENQARKFGRRGMAALASGAAENAAFEAVAQLAVAPPPEFNPSHRRANGFVVRHVQNAVMTEIRKQYGHDPERFGGYVPMDAEGNTIEVAGREPEPFKRADYEAELVEALARDAEKARQLEQLRAALPGGAVPTNRVARVAMLRAFGEGNRAITNAAEQRFYSALAKHIQASLDATAKRESQAEEPIQPDKHVEKPQSKQSASEVPESIRQRLVPTATKSRAQCEAEKFVAAWQLSNTAQEAAGKLNKSLRSVASYAAYLRSIGVNTLKRLPARPGPLVRGVRALVPSAN